MKTKDETWYIAIMKIGSTYSIFEGAYGEQFRDFKEIADKRGIEIVVEQFEISDEEINLLTGFTGNGKRGGRNNLSELKKKLDSGEVEDVQKMFDDLYNSIKEIH